MVLDLLLARILLDLRGAGKSQVLKCGTDSIEGQIGEAVGQDGAILDCLRRALREVGKHGVACVADENGVPTMPMFKRIEVLKLPLDNGAGVCMEEDCANTNKESQSVLKFRGV